MPGAGPIDHHPEVPAPLQRPRFTYRPNDALPTLAWCAELRRGESDVIVSHGPLVETREQGFFEGVWDGPFAEFGFGSAAAVMGSGGCREGPYARFVAPSHTYESLVSLSLGNRLLVSNSIAFALAIAGDGPDLRYPYYHRDLLQLQRRGITGDNPAAIPTARGRQLQLHAATDLLIDRQLTLATRPQRRLPAPRDFAAYRRQLAEGISAILDNAGDAARRNQLRRAATISAGYDSPATAVLAAEAGLRDAVTFETVSEAAGNSAGLGDSGRAMAERLGMRVEAIEPGAWRRLPGYPDLEFLACSSGWAMLPMAGLAGPWRNFGHLPRHHGRRALAPRSPGCPGYAGEAARIPALLCGSARISPSCRHCLRSCADHRRHECIGDSSPCPGRGDAALVRRRQVRPADPTAHRRDCRNFTHQLRPGDPYDHRYANAGDPPAAAAIILRSFRYERCAKPACATALAAAVRLALGSGADAACGCGSRARFMGWAGAWDWRLWIASANRSSFASPAGNGMNRCRSSTPSIGQWASWPGDTLLAYALLAHRPPIDGCLKARCLAGGGKADVEALFARAAQLAREQGAVAWH